MPALGGASAQALRYLDFLIRKPVQAVLLQKGGVSVTVPAPERSAVHKLIVAVLRKDDPNGVAKARKDAQQAGHLIEALTLNSRQADLGFAWMEAWDRGPRWQENLVAGRKRLTSEQTSLLRAAVAEACGHENKPLSEYGFDEQRDDKSKAEAGMQLGSPPDRPLERLCAGIGLIGLTGRPRAPCATLICSMSPMPVEPHAGERTWRNLLKSDANVDLVHFTILRPPEKQDGTPINELSLIAFPTRELFQQKINEFQLIIFDRYARQGVLPIIYFDNIAKYVRNGGAVLVAAGPDYAGPTSLWRTPLDAILPAEPNGHVTEEAFRARLTDPGQRHPVTRGLEGGNEDPPHWGRFFRVVDTKTATGTTVMKGAEDQPLVVLSREGEGRVALVLSDQIWLWARGYEGGGPHIDLLRRLSHWLMKQPDLEEEALRLLVHGHEITVQRQTMADTVAPVIVTSPSGMAQTLALDQAEPGVWRKAIDAS